MNKIMILLLAASVGTASQLKAQQVSLSLSQAVEMARHENRQVQMARLSASAANAQVLEMKSFKKPVVSATGSYQLYAERPVIFLRNTSPGVKVNDVRVGGRNAFNASITGQYPIYQPSIDTRIRLASTQAQVEKEKAEVVKKDMAYQAGEIYLAILLYGEQMKHLQSSRQRNEQALKDARLLFLQGKALVTDTLDNFIAIKNLDGEISALSVQRETSLLQLKHLLGVPDTLAIILSDSLVVPDAAVLPFSTDSLSVMARQYRNDLRMQSMSIEVKQHELKLVKDEYKPQLSAIAQYQVQSQSDRFSVWNYQLPRTSFVGVQINVPIYSGRRQKHREEQVNYGLQREKLALAETESRISNEVTTIRSQLTDAWLQKNIQEKNVQSAEVSYNMFQQRYQYGLASRLELTDAELKLTQARLAESFAIYQIRLQQLQMQKIIGL